MGEENKDVILKKLSVPEKVVVVVWRRIERCSHSSAASQSRNLVFFIPVSNPKVGMCMRTDARVKNELDGI